MMRSRLMTLARQGSVAAALGLALVACTSSGGGEVATDGTESSAPATTAASTTSIETEGSTTSVSGAGTENDVDPNKPVPGALAAEAEWEVLDELWFVWGVGSNDVLHVRSGPGADFDALTSLAAGAEGINRYSEVSFVGETRWTPVVIPGGAGWVNLEFLKPTPSVPTPVIEGVPTVDEAVIDAVLAALADPVALADSVGEEGLLLSTEQFLGEETVVLTAEELRTSGSQIRTWGSDAGEGSPIESSLDTFVRRLAGNTGVTSTETIGYDVTISSGNVINNIAETFPEATVVEYYFGGTAYFGGLDWESLTLAFDDAGRLLAIAEGRWTP